MGVPDKLLPTDLTQAQQMLDGALMRAGVRMCLPHRAQRVIPTQSQFFR